MFVLRVQTLPVFSVRVVYCFVCFKRFFLCFMFFVVVVVSCVLLLLLVVVVVVVVFFVLCFVLKIK